MPKAVGGHYWCAVQYISTSYRAASKAAATATLSLLATFLAANIPTSRPLYLLDRLPRLAAFFTEEATWNAFALQAAERV